MDRETYVTGAFISGGLGFLALWVYAISEWGLLLGLLFGWLPASIGGVIVGFLWPLVAGLAILLFLAVKYNWF